MANGTLFRVKAFIYLQGPQGYKVKEFQDDLF